VHQGTFAVQLTGQAGELKQVLEDVRVNVYGEDMQLIYSGPLK
jgi:hypothetical protein